MRYLYDFLYNSFVKPNGFDLYVHHMDHTSHVTIGHKKSHPLQYIHKTFAAHVGSYLNDLSCDNRKVVLIQTITWDAKYYPISNFVLNPKNGLSIINAIKALKEKSLCEENVQIIILTCMPHPLCKDRDCGLGLNYWRNNAALRAANRFLIEEILKIGYKNLQIVDVMPIVIPRLLKWDDQVLYFNHFLFSGYQVRLGGMLYSRL